MSYEVTLTYMIYLQIYRHSYSPLKIFIHHRWVTRISIHHLTSQSRIKKILTYQFSISMDINSFVRFGVASYMYVQSLSFSRCGAAARCLTYLNFLYKIWVTSFFRIAFSPSYPNLYKFFQISGSPNSWQYSSSPYF